MNRGSSIMALVIGVLTATIPTFFLYRAVTFLCFVPLVLGSVSILLGLIALRRTDSQLGRHVGWITLEIMVVAVSIPFGLIAYGNRSGYPIVLVIPDGYRGPVRLIVDRQKGVGIPLKEGTYTYQIPASGTLVIKDDRPFRQWHSTTAIYSNGQRIPIDYENRLPPDAVVLHSLGSGVRTQGGKEEEYIEDFVGTKAELREYVDRR